MRERKETRVEGRVGGRLAKPDTYRALETSWEGDGINSSGAGEQTAFNIGAGY